VAAIFSGTGGYLDRIKVERIKDFHEAMLQRLHAEHQELMDKLREGEWDDSIESELGDAIAEAIDDFGPDFDAEGNPIEEGESERIVTREEREREGRSAEADGGGAEGDGGEPGGDESDAESEQQEAARA
jgi:ATP synthase alpha/beta chain, C terminal domain